MLRPDQLSRVLEGLTGFQWTWKGYEQLDNDTLGFRIMAGGVDGTEVTEPQHAPSLTSLLVLQRLAEAAASAAVDAELVTLGEAMRRLDPTAPAAGSDD